MLENNFKMQQYTTICQQSQLINQQIQISPYANEYYKNSNEVMGNFLKFVNSQRNLLEEQAKAHLIDALHNKFTQLSLKPIFTGELNIIIRNPHANIEKIIPRDMAKAAKYIGTETNTDIYSCVMSICSAICIAARGRYRVQLERNWSEMLNIYLLIAKKSGEKKSAVSGMLLNPFLQFIEEKQKSYQISKDESMPIQDSMIKFKNDLEKKARIEYLGYINEHGETQDSLESLAKRLKQIQNITSDHIVKISEEPEIFCDIATPLGLAQKLSSQGEAIAMLGAEASFLSSKHIENSSLVQLLLKGYGGERFIHDTSNTKKNIRLTNPSINFLLLIQTEVMNDLYMNKNLNNVGLLPRIIPVFANQFDYTITKPSLLGTYNFQTEVFDEKILKILNTTYTQDKNKEIKSLYCDSNAHSYIKNFELQNSQDLLCGRYKHMSAFIRKLHGQAVRIAGAIHCWNHDEPHKHDITQEEMQAGVELALIGRDHANIAFDSKSREAKRFAMKILKYIYRQDWTRSQPLITTTDLQRNISKLTKENCLPALDYLAERNFICLHHEPRHATICIINPNLFRINIDALSEF